VCGNGEDLFLAYPDGKGGLNLLTRSVGDPPGQLLPLDGLTGTLAPGAMACNRYQLWLIYADGGVQSMPLDRGATQLTDPTISRFGPVRTWLRLPEGVHPRSLAVGRDGLWVLVQVQNPAALKVIDDSAAETENHHASDPTTEPGLSKRASPAGVKSLSSAKSTKDESVSTPRVIDEPRLLEYTNNRWFVRPLPPDWTNQGRTQLIPPTEDAVRPWLVTYTAKSDEVAWWVPGKQGAWGEPVRLTLAEALEPTFAAVQGQLVAATRSKTGTGLAIQLSILRPQRVFPVGTVEIDLRKGPGRWWLVPYAQAAGVVAADASGQQWLAVMDLKGQMVLEPAKMAPKSTSPWEGAQYLLLVVVLAVTTVALVVFWRRDPLGNRVELPRDAGLAPLPLRLVAALIDLAPCVLAACWITGVDFEAIWASRPMDTGSWEDPLPKLLAITLFVVYTTVAEATTRRTLGKALFHLRVAGLKGERPGLGALLGRNAMKAFDLLAPPLLILPIFSPYRQRFGDLLARTVVVIDLKQGGKGSTDHAQGE